MLNYKQIWHGIKSTRWLIKFNLTISYIGNLGLRGFPLKRTCDNVDREQPSPLLTFHDDDFEFGNWFHWKAVLLGYRCGFMFGLGSGYLVLSSEKPKWLVNIVCGR